MTQPSILAKLHTKSLGKTLFVHDSLPSTNDTLKSLAPTLPHGATVIALQQTSGRGRRGRSFYSPGDSGIYMSVLFRQALTADKVGLFTSAAAVAVARAIEATTKTDVQIKWVNDLFIHGKKVCGILAEGVADGVVLGIGINVSTLDFPPELEAIASSLLKESGAAPDRATLVAAILDELETVIAQMDSLAFLEESRRRSAVIGKEVTVLRGDETFSAVAVNIDDTGALVVETAKGRETLFSGEVSLRLS